MLTQLLVDALAFGDVAQDAKKCLIARRFVSTRGIREVVEQQQIVRRDLRDRHLQQHRRAITPQPDQRGVVLLFRILCIVQQIGRHILFVLRRQKKQLLPVLVQDLDFRVVEDALRSPVETADGSI